MIYVHVLLGGILPDGIDGPVTSAGMEELAGQIGAIPNTEVHTYDWGDWQKSYQDMAKTAGKRVLVGYSGGGSRATYWANYEPYLSLDLLVGYDPSPSWQIEPLHLNVRRAICYYNLKPEMPSFYGPLGGGKYVGNTKIDIVEISEQHLLVQSNASLHQRTLAAIRAL